MHAIIAKLIVTAEWRALGAAAAVVAIGAATACGRDDAAPGVALEVLEPAILAGAEQTADPALAVDPETGELLLAWAAEAAGEWNLQFARSSDGGSSFAGASRVNDVPGELYPHAEGAPRLVAAPGVAAVFWNNRVESEGRTWAASDMRFARSLDGGVSWTAARNVQDPIMIGALPSRGHSFHGAAWSGDSTLIVVWIDGRETDLRAIERGMASGLTLEQAVRTPEAFVDPDDPHDDDGVIYAAISHDLGERWDVRYRVKPANTRIQDRVCNCCRVTLARGPRGEVVGAWRSHFEGSIRDPVVQTILDGGRDSSAVPIRIHEDGWVYPGCPHTGPGLDVDSGGNVHVAWYTGAEGRRGVHYSKMRRSTASFEAPTPVLVGDAIPVAHPAVIGFADGRAIVAHNVDDEGRRAVVLTVVSPEGGIAAQLAVPDSDDATHPQLALLPDGRVVIAWTENDGGVRRIRFARLSPRDAAMTTALADGPTP